MLDPEMHQGRGKSPEESAAGSGSGKLMARDNCVAAVSKIAIIQGHILLPESRAVSLVGSPDIFKQGIDENKK
ncbi:MAG: hypothetical protein R2860_05045 [Desulfobacterales bacterium]